MADHTISEKRTDESARDLINDADMAVSRLGSLINTISDLAGEPCMDDPAATLEMLSRIEAIAHFAAIGVENLHSINQQALSAVRGQGKLT